MEPCNGKGGKGDTYRPVDADKYTEGWKRAFGICRSTKCPNVLTCVRWLKTRDLVNNNEFTFDDGEVPCKYYVKYKGKISPDGQELK